MGATSPYRRGCASEDVEQRHLIEWAHVTRIHDDSGASAPLSDYLIFIPQGGNLSKAQRGKFKAMGLKAGVSDLFLPLARGGLHGLWIELKAMDGRPTRDQRAWLERMDGAGYATVVAYGWRQASDAIIAYLEGRAPCNS